MKNVKMEKCFWTICVWMTVLKDSMIKMAYASKIVKIKNASDVI